jgi:molecular chaperone HtpG
MAEQSDATTTVSGAEKLQFQTEARQLLHLMIHSLYSHKEVFIRELISNASDALDRLRFESLTNESVKPEGELAIHIKLDKKARTFTIRDNGIGMSRQEVIDNIGTIARSGSKAFLERLTGDQKSDSNLIGQFGVGFYSVFMVASRVKLVTRRAGCDEPAVVWESDGVSDYTLGDSDRAAYGTEVTLYLNNEGSQYAEDFEVRSVIKRYSDFVAFPIYLPDAKGKDEVVNETKPIWKRKTSEVTAEQYQSFYQQTLGGFDEPMETIHVAAEGVMEYAALLYIPSHAPFDLFGYERKHGVRLYVKRVFITDDCKELLPDYLRFVRGVVDSEDLPLNVSREILQQNAIITRIRRALVGKILGQLKDIAAKDQAKYAGFWKQFGAVLKEGLHMDHDNREQLLELVRFQSSAGATAEDTVSLRQYVERMKPDQKDIYYITGESRAIVEKSPHLEALREKGLEVLFLTDPVDEFVVADINEYDKHKLVSVTRGGLDLGDMGKDDQAAREQAENELRKLAERIKNVLADSVKEVRVSSRLRDSLSCLVNDEVEMGAHMERLMKAMNREFKAARRTLEINGSHQAIHNLNALYERDPKDPRIDSWSHLLYEQALIAEGGELPDPLAYGHRVSELLLDVSSRAVADKKGG